MDQFPTLDAHCHLASNYPPGYLANTGFAIALTLSLDEAEKVIDHREPHIACGRELRRIPISTPVLHWWTGSADETTEAVELGCYFSIHSAVARHSKFRTRVPPERILVETDHGYVDPPAAIPCRIEWVEHLVAQQLKTDVHDIRRMVWQNFAAIIQHTKTINLLPDLFIETLNTI